MTLNRRLATAAAAMVHRMIKRRRPRVFRPVSPFRNGSMDEATCIVKCPVVEQFGNLAPVVKNYFQKPDIVLRLKIKVQWH